MQGYPFKPKPLIVIIHFRIILVDQRTGCQSEMVGLRRRELALVVVVSWVWVVTEGPVSPSSLQIILSPTPLASP